MSSLGPTWDKIRIVGVTYPPAELDGVELGDAAYREACLTAARAKVVPAARVCRYCDSGVPAGECPVCGATDDGQRGPLAMAPWGLCCRRVG
jgi:hypothetical protein